MTLWIVMGLATLVLQALMGPSYPLRTPKDVVVLGALTMALWPLFLVGILTDLDERRVHRTQGDGNALPDHSRNPWTGAVPGRDLSGLRNAHLDLRVHHYADHRRPVVEEGGERE